jgi:hypothetical protein
MQEDIDKLQKQAKDIEALLEQRKSVSAAPAATAGTTLSIVSIDVVARC